MKSRLLGRTGLSVSEIGFGCWAVGGSGYGPTRDEESLEALETAWRAGVNFFDTADTYGQGHSEDLIARFLKGKPRHEIFVATKVGWDFYHGGTRKNFDPQYVRFACEQSLKRLEAEALDLYQLHNPSEELIRSGSALDVMAALKQEGKVRFIGVSIHKESEALVVLEDGRADTLQLAFNLLDQRMADRIFKLAKEKGVGIIVREPLACGLLSGKYKPGHEFHKEDHRRRWTSEQLKLELAKIDRLRSVVATDRLSLAVTSLEFVLDFDAVSTVIPGAKTKTQVLENLSASLEPKLRIEETAQLRNLFLRDSLFRQGLRN